MVERCGVVDCGMLLHDIPETSLGQFQIFAMPGRSQICLRAGLANTGLFRTLLIRDMFQVVGNCWSFLLEYHEYHVKEVTKLSDSNYFLVCCKSTDFLMDSLRGP